MMHMLNNEWSKIPEIPEGSHFKYLPKRRFMDTSNWVRLKKGYDSLDASKNPPIVCWEKIGPEKVRPVLTGSKVPRPSTSRQPSSTSRPIPANRPCISRRPSSARDGMMTRPKSTIKTSVQTEDELPPTKAWTAEEIESVMYKPKLKTVPSILLLSGESKYFKRSNTARGSLTIIRTDKIEEKSEITKELNPYRDFYAERVVKKDPMLEWMKSLWKIANEFIAWFNTLGSTMPEITDSFMINLLASGCHIREMAPFKLEQLEEKKVDLPSLVFEHPISYGVDPFVSQDPTVKPLSKREKGFAYGSWNYPTKLRGKINRETTEKVEEQARTVGSEQSLLQQTRFKNYCVFLKEKGYRIPQILYTMPPEENKKK